MRKITIACILILSAWQLQAQIKYEKYLHNFDVAAGGGLHSVQFDPTQSGDQDPKFGGTINFHYRFAPFERVSFATGIDFTSYRAVSDYDELHQTQKRVDPENGYEYTYNVMFKNWREIQNSINLEVPIAVIYRHPLNDLWGLYAGGGLKLDVPFYKNTKLAMPGPTDTSTEQDTSKRPM